MMVNKWSSYDVNKIKCLNIMYYIIIFASCCIMVFFIQQKEGFHEDEIFSYGSSNYSKDNVFQPYGDKDYVGKTIDNEIIHTKNPFKNLFYFLAHPQTFMEKLEEEEKNEVPVWKTKEEAKEYLAIQKNDVFNFLSVYINQSRDVHPPLFYFLVHIFSILFFDKFSKYIIFILNLLLFVGCCIILKKIMFKLNKSYLSIPVLIMYAFCTGTISTVIFQRMYMLLTFFMLLYTYLMIIYLKENHTTDKKFKSRLLITIILGFMTQYYFCVYAICLFVLVGIVMYKKFKQVYKGQLKEQFKQVHNGQSKEQFKELYNEQFKELFKIHLKAAILGIIIYPASIYHIFFSYRGTSAISKNFRINAFLKLACNAYGLSFIVGIILLIFFSIVSIYALRRKNDNTIFILQFSILCYILIISKTSPYSDIRYIMGILPVIAIVACCAIDTISMNSKKEIITIFSAVVLVFSLYRACIQKPEYLYSGYKNNIKIAKENSNLKFIYIEDNGFNHIQSMPEFMIYDKSLILNVKKDELKYLKDNKELQYGKSFIVSIKRYMDTEEIIKEVTKLTQCSNYELLIDGQDATQNVVYKVYK